MFPKGYMTYKDFANLRRKRVINIWSLLVDCLFCVIALFVGVKSFQGLLTNKSFPSSSVGRELCSSKRKTFAVDFEKCGF